MAEVNIHGFGVYQMDLPEGGGGDVLAVVTGHNLAIDSDSAPYIYLEAIDSGSKLVIVGAEDQTEPLLEIKNTDDATLFGVGLQGSPENTGVALSLNAASGWPSIVAGVKDDRTLIEIWSAPEQTSPILSIQNSDSENVFSVSPAGPIVYSPDGTGYLIKVANGGALSTEVVV